MATTHALFGALLGGVLVPVAPELAPVAFAAGAAGGVAPDLDLYAGHRRTLHFPVYYGVAAALALPVALLVPGPATVAAVVFLAAAALHSAMDALGGGLELRPWEATSDDAVYSHFHGRWLAARRWVRYDGAPEDAALAAAAALPVFAVYGDFTTPLVGGAVALSVGYAAVRRRLVDLGEWLVARAPDPVLARVPERFVADYA